MIQNPTLIHRYNSADESKQLHSKKKNNGLNARVIFTVTALLLFLSFGAFGASLFGDQDAYAATESEPEQAVVIVDQGETLWSIATEHATKGTDVRDYVHELRKMNGLKNSNVKVGQKLLLP
ncbi:LysM peptidoglycan-binding domain-containing protein [Paenibacillus sp. GD4]|jgi:LysM repeat protein|uniref:LysM peptidoglycan-binding domain-containing protein n=1 Tax=Paenibacillus sp. GD4 TaxID=3068890 RepID=UPI002796673A|nr:LysM peptidoglycan-binding domain-containing protein [Paenibacillus sp. GD4]MDQ1909256.1 LysM peptidoglycan-binding domain-containing protein [Paenibacillus sp. GD4]